MSSYKTCYKKNEWLSGWAKLNEAKENTVFRNQIIIMCTYKVQYLFDLLNFNSSSIEQNNKFMIIKIYSY